MTKMKNPNTVSNKEIILSIVHDYIKKSKSFTAHDVHAASKKYGCTLDAFRIKAILKEAYYPISYKITPIVINNGVFDVYHKDDVDPYSYNNAIVRKRYKKVPHITNITNRSATSGKSKEELIELIRDGKIPDRYSIPVRKLKEAGLRRDDKVQVIFTKKYMEILRFKPETVLSSKYTYTIDKYNLLRMHQKFIIDAFGSIDVLEIISKPGSVKIFFKK